MVLFFRFFVMLFPLLLSVEFSSWITDLSFNLVISFAGFSLAFFISVCLICSMVVLWSRYYMGGGSNLFFFYFFLVCFVLSILVLVVSDRFLLVFFGWEGLGVTSFLLVIFYQNWMSFNGGLLTMLTNRLGDGLLLVSFGYWLLMDVFLLNFQLGFFLSLVFVFVTFTKRAQVPFSRWLPAAIAAPTPVSSLVHSSTLVTAGVWLMVRFGQKFLVGSLFWILFGLITLLVASFAAIKECDGKKVVALSTLSQLGLMFLSLSLGGKFICFMHILLHAFAKANLFLGVGRVLHFRFSQQDVRSISSGVEESSLFSSIFVRVLSLRGVAFYSGFFSKEYILLGEVSLVSSFLVVLLLVGVVVLTFSYCLLFTVFISFGTFSYLLVLRLKRFFYKVPIFVMSMLTVFVGYFYRCNTLVFFIFMNRVSGLYWVFLLFRVVLLSTNIYFGLWFFFFQKRVVSFFSFLVVKMLKRFRHRLSSILEPFYLVLGLFGRSVSFSQLARILLLVFFVAGVFFGF